MANLKHVFGGLQKDLVSPYVQVSFAGLSVRNPIPKVCLGFPLNLLSNRRNTDEKKFYINQFDAVYHHLLFYLKLELYLIV